VKSESTISLAGNMIARVDATIQEGDPSGYVFPHCRCKPDWGESTTQTGVMLDRGFLVNVPTH